MSACSIRTSRLFAAFAACAFATSTAMAASSTPPEGVDLVDLTTADSGGVSDSSATHNDYKATKAFDGNWSDTNGRWLSSKAAHMFVVYHFNAATRVNAIRVWSGDPNAGGSSNTARAPKAWTFSGSNDGTTWTTLDTLTSETGWSSGGSRYYQFLNQTAYEYYKYDCTELNGASDYLQIWELEFFYVNAGAPAVGDVALERTGAVAYSVTATEAMNQADLYWIADNGSVATTNVLAEAVAEGETKSAVVSGLANNATYQISVLASNDAGNAESVAGTLYTGALALGAVTNANESGLVAGGVVVSRGSAAPFPLTVNYTISGSSGSAGTTWAAPVAVTIPANAESATLPVVPLVDPSVAEDITITVTLAAGNYEMPATVSKTLTLFNLVAPDGYNVWVAPSAGLASVGSNWSAGRAPIPSDNVLFNGNFSTADCEWDSAAASTVASWTQTNDYSGTVTVDTVFPSKGGFTCLTVSGDMGIASGSITHKSHNESDKVDAYRLRINVGRNLLVASGASITARAKGSYGQRSEGQSAYGGSYNGGLSWGSLTEPYGVGSSANDNGKYTCFAGGAVWIEVAGDTTLDGSINANGIETNGMWDVHAGSGGAVYLKSGTLAGVGKISADCESTGRGNNNRTAAGGRVSVLLTNGELSAFQNTNITAFAGNASVANVGGVGTVLVRTPQKQNGVLYLHDRAGKYAQYGYRPRPNQLTRIPADQTWVVDEIVFGDNAILQVPAGTTLDLRGGLAAISSTGNTLDETGLLVDGGTLLLPEAETHTISGKWIFEPKDFTLNGNLTVTGGAGVGTLLLNSDTTNNARTCGLTVTGNMTVDSGSYLRAVRGGYSATNAIAYVASSHGGARGADSIANRGYDSFFHPRLPGAFGVDFGRVNVGGGAIRVNVGGTLTLNGIATASPSVNNERCGAAGSIDITAARLEGSGRIEANGTSRNYDVHQQGTSSDAGGGGRIAVRLTARDAAFTDTWLANINAKGFFSSVIGARHSSSAGSIYLQAGAQSEGTGTIYIRNTGDTNNYEAVTSIPSTRGGGENDDFRKASLCLEAAARVQLFADLKMVSLTMDSGTVFDLNGNTILVQRATVGGMRLSPGTYTSASVGGYLVDSGNGGSLVVTGGGFRVRVR